jgi:hypothetical protein
VNGSLAALEEGVILAVMLVSYEESGYSGGSGSREEELLMVSGERGFAGTGKDGVWLARKLGDGRSMVGVASSL